MDESDAIITLSRGDATTAEQIRRLLSENRRFEEVFSEYLAAAVVLSGARVSAARDDVFEEQYQGLMAERAAELHGMLVETASADDSSRNPRLLSHTIGREETE